jgi:hypothetical protein
MKIDKAHLLQKLTDLDHKLMNLWINEDEDLNDDERWQIFVVLLESRVELLNLCRDSGIRLSAEQCVPEWLEKMTNHRKEIRLRELRQLGERIRKNKKKYQTYEKISDFKDEENL